MADHDAERISGDTQRSVRAVRLNVRRRWQGWLGGGYGSSAHEPMTTTKRRIEMPFFILCGFGFTALFAALGTVILSLIAITAVFTNSYTVDGLYRKASVVAYYRALEEQRREKLVSAAPHPDVA